MFAQLMTKPCDFNSKLNNLHPISLAMCDSNLCHLTRMTGSCRYKKHQAPEILHFRIIQGVYDTIIDVVLSHPWDKLGCIFALRDFMCVSNVLEYTGCLAEQKQKRHVSRGKNRGEGTARGAKIEKFN